MQVSQAELPLISTKDSTSRKRQRSQSMQSDTSSVKRSLSEGPSHDTGVQSPRADELSTLTLTESNVDIDAYMAEQGEADIPSSISSTATDPDGFISNALSLSEKFALVESLRRRPMKVGETWYVLSSIWYKRWRKACTGEVDKDGPVLEENIEPVDNSGIVDIEGDLVVSVIEGIDVEFVPTNVWLSWVAWYGEPSHPLPRDVIALGITNEPSLELHPRRLRAMRLTHSIDVTNNSPSCFVYASSVDTIEGLRKKLVSAVSIPSQPVTSHRIWKIETQDLDGVEYSSSKLPESGARLLERYDRTVDDALIETGDIFVVEFQQDNTWIIDASKFERNALSYATHTSDVPLPLFNSDDNFFNRMERSSLLHDSSHSSSSTVIKLPSMNTFLKPAVSINNYSSTNNRIEGQEPGTLGLGNMGNTCFMNSALQCLAHTKELTEYFLTGVYREELNPDNPLGMHGAIAEAFGELLQKIWDPNSVSSSYSPREFKQQLQRFAPQFSGYQQHDSQELVAFLLDGLHEDLNRVLKKPYVEKPDWEGGGDKELVQLAQKSWEGYMLRNDSVIVDLFQGQYQSTLVCPECQKVSITFDPFMYLTLPLPVHKKWKHNIFYVPWDLRKPHVKIPVEIGRDSSFKDLRNLLGRWMGATPDNLLTLEIFNHRFYKNLDDSLSCGEMADNDVIVCFELPCHAQQSKTHKRSDNDPYILPLYLCDSTPPKSGFSRGPTLFGYPSVVVLPPEQTVTEIAIYSAVVDRLQRWTSNSRDLYTWVAQSIEPLEQVPIRITGLPQSSKLTEIREDGDVVTVDEPVADEGDITDEKSIIQEDDISMDILTDSKHEEPKNIGPKQGLFELRLQAGHKEFGTSGGGYGLNTQRFDSWEARLADTGNPSLLRKDDGIFCEFDENMKAYYFGDEQSQWEHARWDTWEQFVHPEYTEAVKASAENKNKGISLQDCLDEFTREEQLGEDDLWYCPQCKKHQQATKKFDLWRAPDILVVHLKRFSNSRTLRDKIDTFVDFPIEGLDLGGMVGERKVGKNLSKLGLDIADFKLGDLDEPLVYDLYGVDEHLGGLGGGHYRAYAQSHTTNKWHHFDDSFVSPAKAEDAVNANAYLLFYKRRTLRPLGGKSHDKVEQARIKTENGSSVFPEEPISNTQLPTPPETLSLTRFHLPPPPHYQSPPSSSPLLPDEGLQMLDPRLDEDVDEAHIASQQYDFPSPSSSVAAEPDDENDALDRYKDFYDHDLLQDTTLDRQSGAPDSPDWSPTGSSVSDMNPFSDANVQKTDSDLETPRIQNDT